MADNGLTVMARVDHQANAETVDLDMPATRLVIFGNPKAGTQLMRCAPTLDGFARQAAGVQ